MKFPGGFIEPSDLHRREDIFNHTNYGLIIDISGMGSTPLFLTNVTTDQLASLPSGGVHKNLVVVFLQVTLLTGT